MPWAAQLSKRRDVTLTSVVIPVLNNPELTHQCLQSLTTQPAGCRFEVVALDNGSAAPTRALLAQWAARDGRIRVVSCPENLQFALGCNVGFLAARGAVVVFLNNDTVVDAHWLQPLVQALQNPRVAAVQPKLVYPDGKVQCAGVVFSAHSPLGYPLYAGFPEEAACVGRVRDLKAVSGACMAVRADDFVRAQGFDPLFVNGQEDVDLCLRLIALSPTGDGVCRYEPQARVVHHESRTPGRYAHLGDNRHTFVHRWKGRVVADDEAHYAADGFAATRYVKDSDDNERQGIAIWRPVLGPLEAGVQDRTVKLSK
jgi:GT2 family glycosyltransferase